MNNNKLIIKIIMHTKNKEINFGKILVALVVFMTMSLSVYSQQIDGPPTVTLGSTHTYTIEIDPANSGLGIDLDSTHWGWYHNNSLDITCSTSASITITFTDLELHTVEAELYDTNGNSIENYEVVWMDVNVVP